MRCKKCGTQLTANNLDNCPKCGPSDEPAHHRRGWLVGLLFDSPIIWFLEFLALAIALVVYISTGSILWSFLSLVGIFLGTVIMAGLFFGY